jgi:universal stress protein family protein
MFRETHFSGLRCFARVDDGAVAETIADTAQEIRADLIMMPTRGLAPSRRFLIGSTTAKVLHDAKCAVWTSPHLQELQQFAGLHHMLCTIDRNEIIPEFLKEAVRLASRFESRLSFVTAVPGPASEQGGERIIRTLEKEYPLFGPDEKLDCGREFSLYLESEPIGEVIRRLVIEQKIDLVVTNRGHLQHPLGKRRTHAYEIVLESPCPVLSLAMAAKSPTEKKEHMALQTV